MDYFTLTAEDERVLARPRECIIEPGGQVLVAVDESDKVVGVVAVLVAEPGVFELAKMTVDAASRGQGVGRRLIQSAIAWAISQQGTLLFLGTNSRLTSAIRLYEEADFERTTLSELRLGEYYARADTVMKIDLVHR